MRTKTEIVRIPAPIYSALYGLFVEVRDVADGFKPIDRARRKSLNAAVRRVRDALDEDVRVAVGRVESLGGEA